MTIFWRFSCSVSPYAVTLHKSTMDKV